MLSELDEAGKKELEDLKASLAIHRRRLGKRFDEIVSEDIEWVRNSLSWTVKLISQFSDDKGREKG